MNTIFNSFKMRLFLFALFYGLVMSYGLDLVQAQGSQILPYMAWLNNPEAFQNDLTGMTFPFYGSYSIWYKSAGWLAPLFSPMGVIYLYFFAQCFLEVFGLNFLSKKLFPNLPESYTWFIIILFTFGGVLRHSLGSVAPFGWSVFPDTLATGILLFALGYLFEKRFLHVFILTAICFYFHLSLAFFSFIIFFLIYIADYNKITLNRFLVNAAVFTIIVIPFGLGILLNPQPPFNIDPELWLTSVKNFQGMHVFPSKFGLFQYIPFLFWMSLFAISFKLLKQGDYKTTISRYCLIAGALMVVTTFFTEVMPNRVMIILSFFRGSRFILIFAVFCSLALIYQYLPKIRDQKYLRNLTHISGYAILLFFIFINIIVFHPVYRIYPDFVTNIIQDIEQSDSTVKNQLLYQTIKNDRIYAAEWKDVQQWCKNNTPDDRLILTPYYLRGFRTYSDRGIVFQFRDSQLHIYFHTVYENIVERTDLIGKPIDLYNNPTDYQVALEELYKSLTEGDIRKIADDLDILYLVTENSQNLDFPLKYRNKFFKVYQIE